MNKHGRDINLTEKLEWGSAQHNLLPEETICRLRRFKEVILFGAGKSGEYICDLLHREKIAVICFCDNSSVKQGKRIMDIPVYSFENAVQMYQEAAICLSSCFSDEIYKQIRQYDSKLLERTFFCLNTLAWETWSQKTVSLETEYIRANIAEFSETYERLADELSKKVLVGLLNFRITRNFKYLDDVVSEEAVTYFDESIISGKNKRNIRFFVDGGAYTGDTLESFMEFQTEPYDAVICYEPDNLNAEKLENFVKNRQLKNIIIRNRALWNHNGMLTFQQGSAFSSAVQTGTGEGNDVEAESLDEAFGQSGIRIDMIKLDIEGSEKEALLGAAKIISRDKPILAVCVYHRQEDLIVIPDLISTLYPGYLFYLRQYFHTPYETVLYAVPPADSPEKEKL